MAKQKLRATQDYMIAIAYALKRDALVQKTCTFRFRCAQAEAHLHAVVCTWLSYLWYALKDTLTSVRVLRGNISPKVCLSSVKL